MHLITHLCSFAFMKTIIRVEQMIKEVDKMAAHLKAYHEETLRIVKELTK